MRAETFVVGFFIDHQRPTLDVFANLGLPESRLCRAPFDFGEIFFRPIGHDQGWFEPIRPIEADFTFFRHHQIKLLGILNRDVDFFETFRFRGHHRAAVNRFASCCRALDFFLRLRGHGFCKLTLALGLNRCLGNRLHFPRFHQGQAGGFAFVVEIRIQIILGQRLGWHAFLWHFDFSGPDDRIENNFAEIIDRPVTVVVAAGEADTATAVFALGAPHQRLRFAESIDTVFIPQVDVLFHARAVRHGGNQIENLRAILREAHVVIKLVVCFDQ